MSRPLQSLFLKWKDNVGTALVAVRTKVRTDLSPLIPLSPAVGGIFDTKWRGGDRRSVGQGMR